MHRNIFTIGLAPPPGFRLAPLNISSGYGPANGSSRSLHKKRVHNAAYAAHRKLAAHTKCAT